MAIPPSSRRGRRRSQDQIEEAWWAKQLGHRPEPAAAAEDKSEHRVSSEPETPPPLLVERVHEKPAPRPPVVRAPRAEPTSPSVARREPVVRATDLLQAARRPPLWSHALSVARRELVPRATDLLQAARRSPVWSLAFGRRALGLVGPILVGALVGCLVILAIR